MRRAAPVAVVTWVVAASIAQGVLGADIARAARRIELRFQEEIERRDAPPPTEQQPERSHDESFEPWELVSV